MIFVNKINYVFKSIFKDNINRFLNEKGLVLSPITIFGYSSVLKSFDLWCVENNILDSALTCDVVNKWIVDGCETKSHKVSVMREFAKNMIKYGENAYVIPKKFYKSNERHIPYIFSDKEILNFINYLNNLKSNYGHIYRKDTYLLIFKLLIFTGSRESDILNLKIKDIDFKNSLICINHGKNDIDRVIPIDYELMNELKKYKELVGIYDNENDFFFSNHHKNDNIRIKVSQTSLFKIFREGLKEINIPYKNRKEGPRIHDFRFTFIVKSIQKLVAENKDLNVYLPILSKYVGHTSLSDTLYYFKPKELIFSKDNYQKNSLIPTLVKGDFDEE